MSGVEFHPLSCSSEGFHRSSQTNQASATTLGYLSELYGKILLLKSPHTEITGQGELQLILTWKIPPRGLAFIVIKSVTWGNGRVISGFIEPHQRTKIMMTVKIYVLWCNSAMNVIE